MTTTNTYTKAFATLMQGWQVKQYGSKPTETQLATAVEFSPHRKVGPQTLALAMRLRDEGMTQGQQVLACGAPQNNFSRGVEKAGLFKRDMSAGTAENGHTVYKYTLTPKGEAYITKRKLADEKAVISGDADKPVKAKATKKAKGKRKPKAVVEAVTEAHVEPAVTVNEPPVEAVTDNPVTE